MRFPKTQVIALVNQKGGYGKTTSSVAIASAFCDLGYSVCLADTDPQCNANESFGNRTIPCPTAKAASEIERLSKSYAESGRLKAAQQCEERRTQGRREDSVRRVAAIVKLNAAIDQLVVMNLPGRCTAVNAMMRRAVRETPAGVSIVVSDLENTCAAQGLPANLRPENRVFIVPVGSRQHPIEAAFEEIQSRYARTMPWIQVIEPFRIKAIIESIFHPEPRVEAQR